jgi:hypothetical protein
MGNLFGVLGIGLLLFSLAQIYLGWRIAKHSSNRGPMAPSETPGFRGFLKLMFTLLLYVVVMILLFKACGTHGPSRGEENYRI